MGRTLSGPHPHPTSKHRRLLPGEWLKTQCWTCPLTSKDGLSRHSAPSVVQGADAGRPVRSGLVTRPIGVPPPMSCSRSPTAASFLLNPVSGESQTQRPHVP